MSAPTILLVSGRLWSTIPIGVQGMVPVSWFWLCALPSPPSPGPFRAGAPGRMAPVDPERYVGFLRVFGRSRGAGVGSGVLGQAFRSEGPPGGGRCPKRALRSERWAEKVDERAFVFSGRPPSRRPDCPPAPLGYILFFLGRALARKPVPEGPRVYEPDTMKIC